MSVIDIPHGEAPIGRAIGAASDYATRGFLGPVPLLTSGERALLLNHLAFGKRVEPDTWPKGCAASDRLFYDIASSPRLLDLLRPVLGANIILWGAKIAKRRPGHGHPWHVDIESAAPGQRFASVWIGLQNTSRESGMAFVSRSHKFAKTIMEVQWEKRSGRGEATEATILGWAQELDPLAELLRPEVTDGEAMIFDGRIWHGTLNRREAGTRTALLLQYASTDAPVFMPDPAQREWPIRLVTDVRPPVIVVSGEGNGGGNRQVRPPASGRKDAAAIAAEARPIILPLEGDAEKGWRPHPLFRGPTAIHGDLSCHVSVLEPGRIPHPPHAHLEEEILIVLDGAAELLIGDGPEVERARPHPAAPGMFAYYPAFQHHTLRNAGPGPLTYLMFKWKGAPVEVEAPLATAIVDPARRPPKEAPKDAKPRQTWLLLEGPTSFLGKLHVHFSEVVPGGGYAPHTDPYDVAIIVLAGTIETIGRTVGPFGVVFTAAHEPHGLRNTGSGPARYLVIEFHAEKGARRKPDVGGAVLPARKPKDGKRRKTLLRRLEKLLTAPIRRFVKKR